MVQYHYMKILLTVLLAISPLASFAQQKMEDLLERPLMLERWGKEGDLNSNGNMKTYSLVNQGEYLLFHKNGVLEWNKTKGNKQIKYTYVVKNDTVFITNVKDFWLKFFIPKKTRGNFNNDGYIEFKDNMRQHRFGKLSEKDSYNLYLKCLSEKRFEAAFDYLFSAAKYDSPLLLCALAYHYENNIGIKGVNDAGVTYSMATYHATVPIEEQEEKTINTFKNLVESGLADSSILENFTLKRSYIKLTEKQKNIILAYAHRKLGLVYMPQKGDEDYSENLTSAMEDLDKAININQDATSMFMLGRIYYEGLQGFAEKKIGLDYLCKAAEKNNIAALCYLASIYNADGQKTKAKELWIRASSQKICKPIFTLENISTLENPNNDETINIEYYKRIQK